MAPSPTKEDEEPAKPDTPAKRKANQANNTTPRRSPANRPRVATTPARKTSGNALKTPNTAPARTKTAGKPKNEPTLLGDFLLGRPSPARVQAQRRRSLDVVKAELKQANVGAVKLPGGVKDRVTKWQKSNAAVGVAGDSIIVEEGQLEEQKATPVEGVEDDSVGEEDRQRIKHRTPKRPGRRKVDEDIRDDVSEAHSKSTTAPRKRVVSDEHWMKNRTPKKKSPKSAGQKIPKDFLTKTAIIKEPLANRVQDWIKVSEPQIVAAEKKSLRNRPLRHELKFPKNSNAHDSNQEDSEPPPRSTKKVEHIREQLSAETSDRHYPDDGIRVKPVRQKRKSKPPSELKEEIVVEVDDVVSEETIRTPTHKPEKHRRVSSQPKASRQRENEDEDLWEEEEDVVSALTPSASQRTARKARKSDTPSDLSEIPFGNSAFSVLELPLGAEANTLHGKRPPPKRTPSFGVPNVLKKVYHAVHDAPEPSRGGPSQPKSIESWLNGTSDPFTERATPPQSVVDLTEIPHSENTSKTKDIVDLDLVSRTDSGIRRRRRSQESMDDVKIDINSESQALPTTPLKTRDILPSMRRDSPQSPTSLKRSPATRNAASPKNARRSSLKDSIFDAFKGESAMAGSKGTNPFAEITGSSEKEIRRTTSYAMESSIDTIEEEEDQPRLQSPSFAGPILEQVRSWPRPLFSRGPPPVGGGNHRLSTIVSMASMSASSATETASDISQTTITQDTLLSATTASNLSRKSNNKPSRPKPELKRRLTKHSDLMSVLSLPDSKQPGRAASIRSARSVRTTRTKLDSATVTDVMKEIAEDEAKYMRELKTLVDGVIPVLLTCVLSKSDSAKAAGLFNPNSSSGNDPNFTKPIVDMGIALERMKSLHRRIPLDNADAFIVWADQAHRTYHDYVTAWRTGFQDVVVNLAPVSRTPSGENPSSLDDLPRNHAGDVVGANGERVDVAHLLKRPLVRTKYLNKAIKALVKLDPTSQRKGSASETWDALETFVRKRAKEEEARRIDQAANCTDCTRARNPRTFEPADNVQIDPTRQVYAQDLFSFDIAHSNGQRMTCQVEILLRDKATDSKDCDILICEVDSIRRFLLFPPLSRRSISARMGNNNKELVVLIRGVHEASEWEEEWSEMFVLESDDEEVVAEWLDMLGTTPVPGPIVRPPVDIEAALSEISASIVDWEEGSTMESDVPVGERRRREAEEVATPRPRSSHVRELSSPIEFKQESLISDHVSDRIVDLNDALSKAGMTPRRPKAARYHGKSQSTSAAEQMMSGGLDPYPMGGLSSTLTSPISSLDRSPTDRDLPYIPKSGNRSLPTTPEMSKSSTPLRESMRPDDLVSSRSRYTVNTADDKPPPPPPHKSPSSSGLKNVPVLDSSTPKDASKSRRSSSPLKHEYQPSNASDTTSDEYSDSYSDSYSDTSDEDELEALEMPTVAPTTNIYGAKRISPSGSMYSIPNSTLAPSNSASQGPYRGVPLQQLAVTTRKNMASISGWDNKLGKWVDLHKEPCSIVITPGLLQAFDMTAEHSSQPQDQNPDAEPTPMTLPLLAQVVTPMVPLRQSNALDIEIRVKPNAGTAIKKSFDFVTIRYRAATSSDAAMLYLALHRARLENPVWKKLEEERRVNSFGAQNLTSHNKRSSWSFFKRRKSYRASTRAPSAIPSEQSQNSGSSSFLNRMGRGGGEYNIAKSTIHATAHSRQASSAYTSNPSDYSGNTPPRTPSSPSTANSSYSQAMLKNRGTQDLAIRLYQVHSATKWEDMGPARLTVTFPPSGMRQASALNHGIERRIIITRKMSTSFLQNLANLGQENRAQLKDQYITFLDIVLGADCFQIIGRTGVCATVWEDISGPNGEIGMVGPTGGVAGKHRRWLFQMACQADASYVYNLCAVGGRGFQV